MVSNYLNVFFSIVCDAVVYTPVRSLQLPEHFPHYWHVREQIYCISTDIIILPFTLNAFTPPLLTQFFYSIYDICLNQYISPTTPRILYSRIGPARVPLPSQDYFGANCCGLETNFIPMFAWRSRVMQGYIRNAQFRLEAGF